MRKPWDDPNPVRVELATNARTQTPAWSDISLAVKGNPGITVTRTGRSGPFQRTQPSRCALVVDNSTGQFSDIAGSAPTLFGKRMRVSVRDWTRPGNLIDNGEFTVALGVSGWSSFGFGSSPARTVSTTRSLRSHGQSMLITWGTEAVGSSVYRIVTTVIGRRYEATYVVWVPAGSPAVAVKNGLYTSGNTTGTGKWQILRCRFLADAATEQVGVSAAVSTAGQQCWVGVARVDEGWTTLPNVEDLTSRVNLIPNPSFESGVALWQAQGTGTTIAPDATLADQDAGSCQVTLGTDNGAFLRTNVLPDTIVVGQRYVARGRIRLGTTDPVQLAIRFIDAGSLTTLYAMGPVVTPGPGGWVTLTADDVAPATTVNARLYLFRNASTVGQILNVDSFLMRTAAPGEVVDFEEFWDGGSSSDTLTRATAWTGPDNASTSIAYKVGYTSTPLSGAAGSPVTYRHTGTITGNSVGWPARGVAQTPITSVDRSARLASRTRTFRSVPEEEILSDAPLAYWPLGEAAGSTSAGNVSTTKVSPMTPAGAGAAVVFGKDQASPTSDQTGASFAGGRYLSVRAPRMGGILTFATSGEAAIRTTLAAAQTVLTIGTVYGPNWVVATKTTGVLEARWVSPFDGLLGTLTGSTVVNDGDTHHVALVTFWFGGSLTWRLYVDGVLDASATTATPGYALNDIVTTGGAQNLPGFTGVISHVAAYSAVLSAAAIAEHAAAVRTGFDGEATYGRLIRYARWAGIGQSEIVLDNVIQYAGLMSHIDSRSQSPWEMMAACETVEGGLLYIDGAGNIRFRARGSFYNQAASTTFNAGYTSGQDGVLQNSLTFETDNSNIVNDLEGTRPGGATQRVINQASIDEYELAEDSVTIPASTDDAVSDAIAWRLGLLCFPLARADGLAVRLTQISDVDTAAVMALELGARVDSIDLPPQAPASTLSVILDGWEERYSHAEGALFTATSTSATPPAVWTLEDPVNGKLDSVAVIAY